MVRNHVKTLYIVAHASSQEEVAWILRKTQPTNWLATVVDELLIRQTPDESLYKCMDDTFVENQLGWIKKAGGDVQQCNTEMLQEVEWTEQKLKLYDCLKRHGYLE